MKKNVAGQVVGGQLNSKTDGSAITSGTTTVYVTGNGGAQAAGSVGSGACTHEGQGFWTYAPAQAETNYDHVAFTFTNTNAVTATVQIYTSFPQTVDNLDAAGVRAAIGMASANLDTQINALFGLQVLVAGTSDSGSTTTMVDAARTEADTDYWKGAWIQFTSGNIMGQTRLITGFVPGTDTITFAPATTQAVTTQTYNILTSGAVDVGLWNGSVPNALVAGRMDSSVGAMAANVLTATAINADAITDAKVAADVTIASVTGAVGSVGAGGIVAASFGAGAIDAAAIAANAIGASELATDAVAEIADAIWDELLSGHVISGSAGEALAAAGTAGDPWVTALPGAYGAGTAGNIVGNNLNATVSSRASQASVDAVQADTDDIQARLPAALVSGRMDASVGAMAANVLTATAINADAITAAKVAADVSAEIADAVWDEDATAHQTQGTFGQAIGDPVADTNTIFKAVVTDAAGATVGVDVVAVKSDTAAILIDTAEIGAAGAGLTAIDLPDQTMNITGNLSGSVGSVTGAVGSVTAAVTVGTINANVVNASALAADAVAEIADGVWDEDATGHQTQGTFGQAIGDPVADTNTIYKAVVTDAAGATVGVDVVAVKAETASIQSDTNDIQTRLPAALVSGRIDASVGAMAAGVLTATAIAADAITDAKVAADVTIASVTGAVGSVTGAVGSVTGNVGGNVTGSVGSVATGGIVAGSFAAGAIDAAAIAADAIGSSELAASAVTEIQTGLATSAALAIVQAVTDKLGGMTELGVGSPTYYRWEATALELAPTGGSAPTAATIADAVWDEARAGHVAGGSFGEGVASVQGNVTGSVGSVTGAVGSVGAGGITAASFAADAITAAKIAADVTTELQAGLATSAALATAQTDLDDIQTRLPAALVSGRMDSSVGAMAANVMTAAAAAADLTTELQTGLATSAALATVQADTDDIQARLPAALVGGRIDSSVGAMAAGVLTATAIAGDAITAAKLAADVGTEIAAAVRTDLTVELGRIDVAVSSRLATAGYTAPDNASIATILGVTNKINPMLEDDGDSPSGGYRYTAEALELAPTGGSAPTASQNAAAVWDEARAGHVAAGSFGQGVASVQGSVTGSTASVTGNVGGNVTGSVGSVATGGIVAGSFAAGAIDAAAIAANAIGASELAADAATEIAAAVRVDLTTELGRIDVATSTRASQASVDTLDNFVDTEVSDIKVVTDKLSGMIELGVGSPTYYRYTTPALELAPTGGSAPSAGVIADAVWDELLAGHAIGGSAGAALSAAGTAGDPWSTALPGAYGAGTAGKIVGDNINATISSRATQASVDTIDGIVDNILIDTAEIGAAGAGLTALGDARIANLDATISSRTKPADTQAAVTTVTNLTNAPTAGDFTAVMKTSLNAATPASITGAVGSVTGGVTVTTNNDKTGYRLSATGVDDVWDEAIAGHLAAGTTGKALNDATSAGNPWNSVLEGVLTAGDLLRIQAGVAVGKTTILSTGSGTANVQFRDASDLSLIVEADMTGSERTAVTLSP